MLFLSLIYKNCKYHMDLFSFFRYFIIHKYIEYKVNFPLCWPPTPPSPPPFISKKPHLWVRWVFLQNFCIRSQTCWWLFNSAFFPLGKRQLFNIIHVERCRIYNIVIHKSVSLQLFSNCVENAKSYFLIH